MSKRALITGITGQDGSYLAELLLAEGYEVHGLIRRCSVPNTQRIDHIKSQLHLHVGDILDYGFVSNLIFDGGFDEIYHLAAQSHVGDSFKTPHYTGQVIMMGTLNVLDSILQCRFMMGAKYPKLYNASTSEMFGNSPSPQSETTPFNPISPYGVAKLFTHLMVRNYRQTHDIFAVNGIMFNHESPRRGLEFVTRKISNFVARIERGENKKDERLALGNINARRDWGYAPEYVKMMWKMLQRKKPDDYVVATGETHSVKEFLEVAFKLVGKHWEDFVTCDTTQLIRPKELHILRGNPSKAMEELKWKPKVMFKDLVTLMVTADVEGWK